MTLKERIEAFKHLVNITLFDIDIQDDKLLWGDGQFFEYWTEHSHNAKLARWEKEKVFDVKKRFATWKRNAEKWDKKPIQKSTFVEKVISKSISQEELFKQLDQQYGNSNK